MNAENKHQNIDICTKTTELVFDELDGKYTKLMISNIVNNNHQYFLKNNLKYSLSSPESNIQFLKRKVLRRIERLIEKEKEKEK